VNAGNIFINYDYTALEQRVAAYYEGMVDTRRDVVIPRILIPVLREAMEAEWRSTPTRFNHITTIVHFRGWQPQFKAPFLLNLGWSRGLALAFWKLVKKLHRQTIGVPRMAKIRRALKSLEKQVRGHVPVIEAIGEME
jgi:hypothetical protein